mmetsp:Transcript_6070/g.18841  ORF Transcript_6070/g.18841 Transcript_6070/m.18841 type:complete len:133 (-) Transcript_6070:10-408(-)
MGQGLSHQTFLVQESAPSQPLFAPVGAVSLLAMGPLGIRGAATPPSGPRPSHSPWDAHATDAHGLVASEVLLGAPPTVSARPHAPAEAGAPQPTFDAAAREVQGQHEEDWSGLHHLDLGRIFVSSAATRAQI